MSRKANRQHNYPNGDEKNSSSFEDKLNRGILFVCGLVFAVPTYIFWRDALVRHQWPDDHHSWIGLIMAPLISIGSFAYAIFYSKVKKVGDRLKSR